MPESGTIFVGDKGKMWCETYSESPRLIPESAMQAFTASAADAAARAGRTHGGHEKNWLDAIRKKGQAVSHFDYAGPFTETRAARQRRAAVPGPAPVVGRGEHEGHEQARGRPVRPAHLSSGWSRLDRLQRSARARSCVPMHRTSTAGSGSRDLASPATCGASRTRR